MKTFAYVVDGVVFEIIPPVTFPPPDASIIETAGQEVYDALLAKAGEEIPIDERYTPEFVSSCVDISDVSPKPDQNWTYDGTVFSQPKPYVPSAAEILASNTAQRDALLSNAALAIAPLQDAVDLDEATDAEVALLKQWKQYRVAVNRVDLTQAQPLWPTAPAA